MRNLGYGSWGVAHDHFDGYAYCRECGGKCRLRGTAMAYSALVRKLFEHEAATGMPLPSLIAEQLASSGIDLVRFRSRAKEGSRSIKHGMSTENAK